MEMIETLVHQNNQTFLTFIGDTITSEHMKPDLNLVLCGRRGAGKTSVAKAILGQTELYSVSTSVVCGRQVSLVELPAMYGKPQEEVMKESFRCVSLYPDGIHAFILVIPVGHLTDDDKGELLTIQNTFGSQDFTMILFTVESDPTDSAVVKLLKGNKDIDALCQSCGGEYVVFSIKDTQQVPRLLDKVDEMRLHNDKIGWYTADMFTHAQIEKILQQEKSITMLQGEISKLKEASGIFCKYFGAIKFYTS